MRRVIWLLFLAAVVSAVPALAQDEEPPHFLPVEVHVGGGYTFAISQVRQYLGDGFHVNAGVTLSLNKYFGIEGEYGFTGLGQKTLYPAGIPPAGALIQPIHADMNMQYFDGNIVLKIPTKRRTKAYLIGGVGLYYRPAKITVPTAGYVPGYCYPYYYVCYPGGYVETDQTLASATTTSFGIDFGGGMFVLMNREAGGGFYIESRYHYMWGPELKDSSGVSYGKANGKFVPITIGLRF